MTDLPLRAGGRDPAAPVLGHHGHLTAPYLKLKLVHTSICLLEIQIQLLPGRTSDLQLTDLPVTQRTSDSVARVAIVSKLESSRGEGRCLYSYTSRHRAIERIV